MNFGKFYFQNFQAPVRRRCFRIGLSTVLLVLLGWLVGWLYKYTAQRPLAPRGGIWFPIEKRIDLPYFAQGDERWGKMALGPTQERLEDVGCAVTSAAMVLAGYGADVDPLRLNQFVTQIQGYTPQGWIYWEAAAEYPPKVAWLVYENAPSYWLIDFNLLQNNPVIIRIRYPSDSTHFVVIVGKRGWDYLIQDPGSRGKNGPYPLKELNSPIEALRFYQLRDGGRTGATPVPVPKERVLWLGPSMG